MVEGLLRRLEHQLDLNSSGWPARHHSLRHHDHVRIWVQCPPGSRTERNRRSSQREQLAQSGSLREPTRGDYDWAVRLFALLGGAPTQYYGPGYHRLDFSLFKNFNFTEKIYLQFRAEFFNLTEHAELLAPRLQRQWSCGRPRRTDYTSPTNFGKITSTRDGQNDQREIQFALKLYF